MSDKSTSVENKFKSYYTKSEVDSISQYLSSSISTINGQLKDEVVRQCWNDSWTNVGQFIVDMQHNMSNSNSINFKGKFSNMGIDYAWYMGTYFAQNFIYEITTQLKYAGVIMAVRQDFSGVFIGIVKATSLNDVTISWSTIKGS